ncbi:MAG TPA: protein kinase [Candidatus Competibacter sp.]|nr:protein kinase [Candidatus Competibacteraceae bacterium]HRW65907.1 protein kinase [Candidatus Competibacter sp.]
MNDITSPTTPSKSGSRRANALPSDYMLDEYRIDSILGAGGFGVTYKALDTHLQTWVAIKEYFPVEWSFRDSDGVTVYANTQGQSSQNDGQISDYAWGLERFLDEARVLAQIQHPYVVRVKRYFRAHGTAYIVMDYEEGEPLSAVLQDGETLDEEEVRGLLEDILPALQAVHEQGYLHRDIKPANLYLRASDHRVILIDFGAARGAIGRQSKSVTSLVTPGYSPPEQYTTRNERYGTWTDIYALAAVLYRCVTGHPPMEAAERLLDDHLQPATEVGAGRYSTNLLRVIDRALAVRPELRFRTVAEMQMVLDGSQVEDSDETVIMLPRVRSGKATPVPELSPLRDEPAQTPMESQSVGENWLEMTEKPTAASRWSLGARKSKKTGPFVPHALQWQSLGLQIGGSLALAVAAGLVVTVVVWLWPSSPTPEEPSPPRYSLGQHGQPVMVSAPAVTKPSGISASNGIAALESPTAPVVVGVPSATPLSPSPSGQPVAGSDEQAEPPSTVIDTVAEPPSHEKPATAADAVVEPPFQEEPTTAAGAAESTAGTGVVPLAPAALSAAALSAAARGGESSAAQPASKPVAAQPAPRSRKTERRAERSRASQKRDELKPIVVTPPALRRTQPAPASRKLWEPPTSTGFNQK